jgi:uncharacterized membrane protein
MQPSSPSPSDRIPGLTQRNIEAIAQLEQEFRQQRSRLDRGSDAISAFVGSIQFVIAHAVGLAAWVALNIGLVWLRPFDPYPFVFLNLVLAVETVFLSTFVLMSQNRQNHQADRWAHLNLQLSMLSEQEATKMLQLLQQICDRLGLQQVARDRELREMVQTTQVEVLAEELDQAREAQEEPPPQEERPPDQPAP